jgi:hypothetical protein
MLYISVDYLALVFSIFYKRPAFVFCYIEVLMSLILIWLVRLHIYIFFLIVCHVTLETAKKLLLQRTNVID